MDIVIVIHMFIKMLKEMNMGIEIMVNKLLILM